MPSFIKKDGASRLDVSTPHPFAWCCNGTRWNYVYESDVRFHFRTFLRPAIPAVGPSFLVIILIVNELAHLCQLVPCMSTLCHQPSFCLCPLPSPLTCFNWTEGLLNTCGRLRPSLSLVLWCWMLTRTRQQRFDTTWRWFKSAESYRFYKTHMCHTCCFVCRSSQSSSYIRWKQVSSPEPCEALLFLFWIGGENG